MFQKYSNFLKDQYTIRFPWVIPTFTTRLSLFSLMNCWIKPCACAVVSFMYAWKVCPSCWSSKSSGLPCCHSYLQLSVKNAGAGSARLPPCILAMHCRTSFRTKENSRSREVSDLWYRDSSSSSMFWRHNGQVLCFDIQGARHVSWNLWPQRRTLKRGDYSKTVTNAFIPYYWQSLEMAPANRAHVVSIRTGPETWQNTECDLRFKNTNSETRDLFRLFAD